MSRKLPFTYEEFKAIYSRVPRLCVDLLIKTNKGYLLLLRKNHGWEGQWHLPGGTVYYQEKIHDAVQRIAQEELGCTVIINRFIKYIEYPNEEKERGFGYSVSLLFDCSLAEGAVLHDEEQIEFFTEAPEKIVAEHRELLV